MKYQVSFRAKTWYLHMWKYHCCYGYMINCTFHTKKLFKENVWYFIGVYIVIEHYLVAWRYEISLLMLKKIFHSFAVLTCEMFSTLKEKFRISVQPCNVLYVVNDNWVTVLKHDACIHWLLLFGLLRIL